MGDIAADSGAEPLGDVRLTLRELADRSGMTARNIRAHQTRGLLPPPESDGRQARYGASHLARLRTITALQKRGFNLVAIEQMLADGEELAGLVLRPRLGPVRGTVPVDDEVTVSPEAIAAMRAVDPEYPERLARAQVLTRQADGAWRTSAGLSALGTALWAHGINWMDLDVRLSNAGAAAAATARLLAAELVRLARADADADAAGDGEVRARVEDQMAMALAFYTQLFEVALVRSFAVEIDALLEDHPAQKR